MKKLFSILFVSILVLQTFTTLGLAAVKTSDSSFSRLLISSKGADSFIYVDGNSPDSSANSTTFSSPISLFQSPNLRGIKKSASDQQSLNPADKSGNSEPEETFPEPSVSSGSSVTHRPESYVQGIGNVADGATPNSVFCKDDGIDGYTFGNAQIEWILRSGTALTSYPLSPGSLTVYVKNVNGNYVPGVRVVLYDVNWNKLGEQTTNSAGYVYWSSLADGTYYIEAYYRSPAALGYEEFWGGDQVTVSGATTIYFTRHTQWTYQIKVNGQIIPGSNVEVNPGENIHVDVTVKNSESVAKDVMVTLILDRDKSSPWDLNQQRGPVNIASNNYGSFGWDYSTNNYGSYWAYIVVYGYYNGRYIVTDQYNWVVAVYVKYPDLVWTNIWTSPSPPTGGQSARIYCELKNQGTGNTPLSFTNYFYIDGGYDSYGINNGLAAGAVYDWYFDRTLGPGYHTILASADVNNNVPEANEGNNQLSQQLWWKGPDLIVVDIWWIDAYSNRDPAITSGQPFTVYFQIKNNGDADAVGTFTSYIFIDGWGSAAGSNNGLGAGATYTWYTENVFISSPTGHSIRAVVDYNGAIAEANKDTGSGTGTGETNNERTETVTVQKASWTVITLLSSGSNFGADLSYYVDEDINRIKEVGSSTQISLVTLADKSGNGDTHAYFFKPNAVVDIPLSDINPSWTNELDMGDPATFEIFSTYMINRFRADHFSLSLFDHGGDLDGVIGDDISFNSLQIEEIGDALRSITQNTGLSKLDIFGLDACLMGMTEMAYEIRNYAYVFVGSEKVEWGCPHYPICLSPSSWRYNEFLSYLRSNPTTDRNALATRIVDTYVDHYLEPVWHASHSVTLSAINLDYIENLANKIDNLANLLKNNMHAFRVQMQTSRAETEQYDHPRMVDLYHFTERIYTNIADSAIRQACLDLQNALTSAIIRERHHTGSGDISVDHAHGLTIWFPNSLQDYNTYSNYYSNLDFSQKTWDEFLYSYTFNPNTPPVVTITSPSSGAIWAHTKTITWTGADDDSDQVSYSIYISTDSGSTWQLVLNVQYKENPTATTHTTQLDTTIYSDSTNCIIKINYDDNQGGVGSVSSGTFTIDNTPPTTGIVHFAGSPTVSIIAQDRTAGVYAIYYRIDGSAWNTYSVQFTLPSGDTHTIESYSRDNAGNDGPIVHLTVYYMTMSTNHGSVSPGSGWYDLGTTVAISATVSAGDGEDYLWNGWTGTGTGSYTGLSNPANVGPINGPISETASFTHKYRLIISVSPVGTGYTTPNVGTYWIDAGQTINIQANANPGYTFDHWILDNNNVGNQPNPYPVQMNAPHSITAYFVSPGLHTVTFYTNPLVGSITFEGMTYINGQTGSYADGSYSATANPPTNYAFHHWEYGAGVYVSNVNNNPTTVQISGDGWLKAIFSARITFYTTPSSVGSITYDGTTYTNGQYIWEVNLPPEYGNTRSIQANTPSGYTFTGWTTAGSVSVTNPSNPSTTLTVNGPGDLTANFSPIIYRIHLESKEDNSATSNLGTITFDGSSFGLPTNVSKTAGSYSATYNPASGYAFDHWETTGGISVASANSQTTTVTVSNAGTLTAVYKTIPPVFFEDGFESGSFSSWTGTAVTTGETATVVNIIAHHGSYSATFTSNGNGGFERAFCYKTITSSSELYARSYFRVAISGIADNDDRFYFIIFRAGSNTAAFAGWRQIGGVVKWNLLIRDGTGWAGAYSAASPLLNQWYCVELHWKKDATSGVGELWVDGVFVCSVTGKNTAYYGDVNRVDFGLAEIVNCAASTVYGDCSVIAETYVGPEVISGPIFTDGFESGSFSAWTSTGITSGETAAIVNTIAHHFTYSALFTSNGNGGFERAYCYKAVSSSTELYTRGYFYVSAYGIADNDDRFYLIIFRAGSNTAAFAGWRQTGGVVKWNLLIRDGTGWAGAYSTTSPSLNQWYCVELHWKKDGTNGIGELWINGLLVCSITGRNTAYYGDINRVDFGLAEIVNCGATTVYGDCCVISNTYIGPEPSATIFADGFESGSFSSWTGTSITSGETAAVVNTMAHQGTYSAMFTSNGNGGFERAYCYKAISSLAELYARGYFRVATSGIADNDDRFYFLIFRAGSQPVAFAGWRQTGGIVRWNLLIRDGTGWAGAFSAVSPSLNQWYCVELHWVESASGGYGELWVNGVLVCSITGKNTAYYGDVNRVDFGLAEIVNCGATTVYGDCCAISRTYIGVASVSASLNFLQSKDEERALN